MTTTTENTVDPIPSISQQKIGTCNQVPRKGVWNCSVDMKYPLWGGICCRAPILYKIAMELQLRDFTVPEVDVTFHLQGVLRKEKSISTIKWKGCEIFFCCNQSIRDIAQMFQDSPHEAYDFAKRKNQYFGTGLGLQSYKGPETPKVLFFKDGSGNGNKKSTQEIEDETMRIFSPLLAHIVAHPVCWPRVSTVTDSLASGSPGDKLTDFSFDEYRAEWPSLYVLIPEDRECFDKDGQQKCCKTWSFNGSCTCGVQKMQSLLKEEFGGDVCALYNEIALDRHKSIFFKIAGKTFHCRHAAKDRIKFEHYAPYYGIAASFSPLCDEIKDFRLDCGLATVAIRPHYVDRIYVFEHEEALSFRKECWKTSDRLSDDQLAESYLRERATAVTLKRYLEEGMEFKTPLIVIDKLIGIDEVEIVTAPKEEIPHPPPRTFSSEQMIDALFASGLVHIVYAGRQIPI